MPIYDGLVARIASPLANTRPLQGDDIEVYWRNARDEGFSRTSLASA
jgi:hypothetical protein